MRYLVDASIVAEVRKGALADKGVANWWAAVRDDRVYLSVLALADIRRRIERTRSRDAERAAALEAWFTGLQLSFDDRWLPIDRRVADAWGRLAATRATELRDGLQFATAKAHRLALVSRTADAFAGLGVEVVNPFAGSR